MPDTNKVVTRDTTPISELYNKLLTANTITKSNYTESDFKNWITNDPNAINEAYDKLASANLITKDNYSSSDFKNWLSTDPSYNPMKTVTPNDNISTKNDKSFNAPIGENLYNKFSLFGKKHNLQVTDTNDTKDASGKSIHSSKLQLTGRGIDVNFKDKSIHPDKIYNAIMDGKKHGVNMEYEVSDPNIYKSLIGKNPKLQPFVKLLPNGRITAPHFSVYDDPSIIATGNPSQSLNTGVLTKDQKIKNINDRALKEYKETKLYGKSGASVRDNMESRPSEFDNAAVRYRAYDKAFQTGELDINDFNEAELNNLYGRTAQVKRNKELAAEQKKDLNNRLNNTGFNNKVKNFFADYLNSPIGDIVKKPLGIDDLLEIKDGKINIAISNESLDLKKFLSKDEILNLQYHPLAKDKNPNSILNKHLRNIQEILTGDEKQAFAAESTGIKKKIELQNQRLTNLYSTIEQKTNNEGLFKELKELKNKQTLKTNTPDDDERYKSLVNVVLSTPEINEVKKLEDNLDATRIAYENLEGTYGNIKKLNLIKAMVADQTDLRRKKMGWDAALVEDILQVGERTLRGLAEIPKDVIRFTGVIGESLTGLDLNATDSEVKDTYRQADYLYASNKSLSTFHQYKMVGDKKVLFDQKKPIAVYKDDGYTINDPLLAQKYIDQAAEAYEKDGDLNTGFSFRGLVHGVEQSAPDLMNIFTVGGIMKSIGTSAIKGALATNRVSKIANAAAKMANSSRFMEASSLVPVFVGKTMESAIRDGGAITADQLALSASVNLAAESIAESVFGGPLGKILSGKGITRSSIKNLSERHVKDLFQNIATGKLKKRDFLREFYNIGKELAKDTASEGFEEALISVAQPSINAFLNNMVATQFDSTTFDATDVASDFAVGAASGHVMGAVRAGGSLWNIKQGSKEYYSDLIESITNGNMNTKMGDEVVKNPEAFKIHSNKLLENKFIDQATFDKITTAVDKVAKETNHLPQLDQKYKDPGIMNAIKSAYHNIMFTDRVDKSDKVNTLYRNLALKNELLNVENTNQDINPLTKLTNIVQISKNSNTLKELDVNIANEIYSYATPTLTNTNSSTKLNDVELNTLQLKHKEIAESLSKSSDNDYMKEKILEIKLEKAKNEIIKSRSAITQEAKDKLDTENKNLTDEEKNLLEQERKRQIIDDLFSTFRDTDTSKFDVVVYDDGEIGLTGDNQDQLDAVNKKLEGSGIKVRDQIIAKPDDTGDDTDGNIEEDDQQFSDEDFDDTDDIDDALPIPVEEQKSTDTETETNTNNTSGLDGIESIDDLDDPDDPLGGGGAGNNNIDNDRNSNDGNANDEKNNNPPVDDASDTNAKNNELVKKKRTYNKSKSKKKGDDIASDITDKQEIKEDIAEKELELSGNSVGRFATSFVNAFTKLTNDSPESYLKYLKAIIYPKFLQLANPFRLTENAKYKDFKITKGSYPTVDMVPNFSNQREIIDFKDASGKLVTEFKDLKRVELSTLERYFTSNNILKVSYSLHGIPYTLDYVLSDFIPLVSDITNNEIFLRTSANASPEIPLSDNPSQSEIEQAILEIREDFTKLQDLRKFIVGRLNKSKVVNGKISGKGYKHYMFIRNEETKTSIPGTYSKANNVYPLSMFNENGIQQIPILIAPVKEDGVTTERLYINGEVKNVIIDDFSTKDNYKPSFAYPSEISTTGEIVYSVLPMQNRKLGSDTVTVGNGDIIPVSTTYIENTPDGQVQRNILQDSENIISTIKLLLKNYMVQDSLNDLEKTFIQELGVTNTSKEVRNYIRQFIDLDIVTKDIHKEMNKNGIVLNSSFLQIIDNTDTDKRIVKSSNINNKEAWDKKQIEKILDTALRSMYFRVDYDKLLSSDNNVKLIHDNAAVVTESYKRLVYDNIYPDFDIAIGQDSDLSYDNETMGHRTYSPVMNQRINFDIYGYEPLLKNDISGIDTNVGTAVVKQIGTAPVPVVDPSEVIPKKTKRTSKVKDTKETIQKTTSTKKQKVDKTLNENVGEFTIEDFEDDVDTDANPSIIEGIPNPKNTFNKNANQSDVNTTFDPKKNINDIDPKDIGDLFYATVLSDKTKDTIIETPKNVPGLPHKFIKDAVNTLLGEISKNINYITRTLDSITYRDEINGKLYNSYLNAINTIESVYLPKLKAQNDTKLIEKFENLKNHFELLVKNWSIVEQIADEQFKLITGENLEHDTLDDQADEDRVLKVNQKKKIRKNVKLLLKSIIKNDTNGKATRNLASIINNNFEFYQYEDIDKVMDNLFDILSISNENYYEPTASNMISILEKNVVTHPWLKNIINTIMNNTEIQSEFLRSFYNVNVNSQKLIYKDDLLDRKKQENIDEDVVEPATTYTKLIPNQANYKSIGSKVLDIWRGYLISKFTSSTGEIKFTTDNVQIGVLNSYITLFSNKSLINKFGIINRELLKDVSSTGNEKIILKQLFDELDIYLNNNFPKTNDYNTIADKKLAVNKVLAKKILEVFGIDISNDLLKKITSDAYNIVSNDRVIKYDVSKLIALVKDVIANDYKLLVAGTFNPINLLTKPGFNSLANFMYQHDPNFNITPDTAFRDGSIQIQVYQIPRLFYLKMSKLLDTATNLIFNLTNDRNGKKHFSSNAYWKNLIINKQLKFSTASLQVIEEIGKPNTEKDIHAFSEKKLLESALAFFLGGITDFTNSIQNKERPIMKVFGKSLSDSKFMTFFESPKLDFIGPLNDRNNFIYIDVPTVDGKTESRKVPVINFLMDQLVKPEAHRILNEDPTGLQNYNKDYFYNVPLINLVADKYNISLSELAQIIINPVSTIDETDIIRINEIYTDVENALLTFIEKEVINLTESFDTYRIGYSVSNTKDVFWNMVPKSAITYYRDRLAGGTPQAVHNAIIQDLAVNYLVSNANASMLVYGDPAMYSKNDRNGNLDPVATTSNLIKRLKGFSSPREVLDKEIYEYLMGRPNINYLVVEDVKGISPAIKYLSKILDDNEITDDEIKILKDPKSTSDILQPILDKYPNSKHYFNTNKADAQEFVHWKHHLATLVALGELTMDKHDKLVDIITNNPSELFNDFDKENANDQNYISTSDVKQIFAPFKPLYTGQVLDGPVEKQYYIKSSHFVLLPGYAAGLESALGFMDVNKIDRLTFESGVKLGIHGKVKLFVNDVLKVDKVKPKDIKLATLPLPVENYGKQLHNPADKERSVAMSVQAQKGIFANIKNEIVDFRGKKIKISVLENLRNSIHKRAQMLIKKRLLEKLGVNNSSDSIDIESLVNLMNNELKSGRYDDNVKQSVSFSKETNQFTIPIWLRSNPGALESIIANIINKAGISKIKRPGFGFVQVSGLGQKTITDDLNKYDTHIIPTKNYNATKGLQHMITNEKGQVVSQIIVPWLFKNSIDKYLDADKKYIDFNRVPEDILTLFGYRIPNQYHSSMIAVEVVGFLPPIFGNTVIVPTEIVTQMGADFDVDKLYTYMKAVNDGLTDHQINLQKRIKELRKEVKDIYDDAPDHIREAYTTVKDFIESENQFRKANPSEKWNPINTALFDDIKQQQRLIKELFNEFNDSYFIQLSNESLDSMWNDILDIELAVVASSNPVIQKSVRKILDGPMKELKEIAKEIDELKNNDEINEESHLSLSFNTEKYISGSQAKDILGIASANLVFSFLTQNTEFKDMTGIGVAVIDDISEDRFDKNDVYTNQRKLSYPFTSRTIAQLRKSFPKIKEHVFVQNLETGDYRLAAPDELSADEQLALQLLNSRKAIAEELSEKTNIPVRWVESIDDLENNQLGDLRSELFAELNSFLLKHINGRKLYSEVSTSPNVVEINPKITVSDDQRRLIAKSLAARVSKLTNNKFIGTVEGTNSEYFVRINSSSEFKTYLRNKYGNNDQLRNQTIDPQVADIMREPTKHTEPTNDKDATDTIQGYYDQGKNEVVLAQSANQETIIHEFLHPFIEDYKIFNPDGYIGLYEQAVEVLGDQEIENVKLIYPEDQVESEIITRAIAKLGNKNIDETTSKRFIDKVLEFIKWLKNGLYNDLANKIYKGETITSKDISTIENIQHIADVFTLYKGNIQTLKTFNRLEAERELINETSVTDGILDNQTNSDMYEGITIEYSDKIKTQTGEIGAAQYDRNRDIILINPEILKKKYDEKAWTKPRKQKDGSFAESLDADIFPTYEDFENFVIQHEYQHSLLSRDQFIQETGGIDSTIGQYEHVINMRALEQIDKDKKQNLIEETLKKNEEIVRNEVTFEQDIKNNTIEEVDTKSVSNLNNIKVTPVDNSFDTFVKNLSERIIKDNELANDIEYKTTNMIGVQSASVDNINEDDMLAKLNLTRDTAPLVMILIQQGFDNKQIPFIIAQPIIVDYFKELKRKGRAFNFNTNLKTDAFETVLKKYGVEPPIEDPDEEKKAPNFTFKLSDLKKTIQSPFVLIKDKNLSDYERKMINNQLFNLISMLAVYDNRYSTYSALVKYTNINSKGAGKDIYSFYDKIKGIYGLLVSKTWGGVQQLFSNNVHTTSIDIMIEMYNKLAEKDMGISILHHQNNINDLPGQNTDSNIFSSSFSEIESILKVFGREMTPYLENKLFETIRDVSKAYVFSNVTNSIYNANNAETKSTNTIREELLRGSKKRPPLHKIILGVKNKIYENLKPDYKNGIDQNQNSVRISNNTFINLLDSRTINESAEKSTTYIVTNSSNNNKLDINDVHADVIDLFNNPIEIDGDYTTKDMIIDMMLYSFSLGHKQVQASFTKFIPEILVQGILLGDGNIQENYGKLGKIVEDPDLSNVFNKILLINTEELVPSIPKTFLAPDKKTVLSTFQKDKKNPRILRINTKIKADESISSLLIRSTEEGDLYFPVIKYMRSYYEYDSNLGVYILIDYIPAKPEYGIYVNEDLSNARRVSNKIVSQSNKPARQEVDILSTPNKDSANLIEELERLALSSDIGIRNQALFLKELLSKMNIDDVVIEYIDSIPVNDRRKGSIVFGAVSSDPKDRTIKISREINKLSNTYPYHEVLLHEVGHIVTRQVIEKFLNFENSKSNDPEAYGLTKEEVKILRRLNDSYKALLKLPDVGTLSAPMTNLHEFVTEALTSNKFREYVDKNLKTKILDKLFSFFKAIADALLGTNHPYLQYSDVIIGDIISLSTKDRYGVLKYSKPGLPSYIVRQVGSSIISVSKEVVDPTTKEITSFELINSYSFKPDIVEAQGYKLEQSVYQSAFNIEKFPEKQVYLDQFQDAIGTILEDPDGVGSGFVQMSGKELPPDTLPYMLALEAVTEQNENLDDNKIEYTKSVSWFKIKTSNIKYKKIFELFNKKLDKISKKIKSKEQELDSVKRGKALTSQVFSKIKEINDELDTLADDFKKTLKNLNTIGKLKSATDLYKFYAGVELDLINILDKDNISYNEVNYAKSLIDDLTDKLNVKSNSYILSQEELNQLRVSVGNEETDKLIEDFAKLEKKMMTKYLPKLIKHQEALVLRTLNQTTQNNFTEESFKQLIDEELVDINYLEQNLLGFDRTADKLSNLVANKLATINQEAISLSAQYKIKLTELYSKAAPKLKKYLTKDSKFGNASPLLDSFGNFISDYTDLFFDSQNKMQNTFKEALTRAKNNADRRKAYKLHDDWIRTNKVAMNPIYILDEKELKDLGFKFVKIPDFDKEVKKHRDYLIATLGQYKYDFMVESVRKSLVEYLYDQEKEKEELRNMIGTVISTYTDAQGVSSDYKFTKEDANKAYVKWQIRYNPMYAAMYNFNGKSVIEDLANTYKVPIGDIRISNKYVKLVPRKYEGNKSKYEKVGDKGFYNNQMQKFYDNNEYEIIDFIEHANDLLYKRDELIPDEKKYNISSRNIMFLEKDLWGKFLDHPAKLMFLGLNKSRVILDYFKSLASFKISETHREFDPDQVSVRLTDDNATAIKKMIDSRISKFYNNPLDIKTAITKYSDPQYLNDPKYYLTVYKRIKQEVYDEVNSVRSFDLEKALSILSDQVHDYEVKLAHNDEIGVLTSFIIERFKLKGVLTLNNKKQQTVEGNKQAEAVRRVSSFMNFLDNFHKNQRDNPLFSKGTLGKSYGILEKKLLEEYKQEKKDVDEKLNRFLSKYTPDQIAASKQLQGIANRYYDKIQLLDENIANLGKDVYVTEFITLPLMKATQLLGLGYSVLGHIGNLIAGQFANLQEAIDGRLYNTSDYRRSVKDFATGSSAMRYTFVIGSLLAGAVVAPTIGYGLLAGAAVGISLAEIWNRVMGKVNKTAYNNVNKTNKFIDNTDVMSRIANETFNDKYVNNTYSQLTIGRYSSSPVKDIMTNYFSIYRGTEAAEEQNQGISTMAYLRSRTVEDVNGNQISLLDALDNDGKFSNLPDEVEYFGKKYTKDKFTNLIANEVKNMIRKNQGDYTDLYRADVLRNVLGKALFQFKRWMIELNMLDFQEEQTDYGLTTVKGDPLERKGRIISLMQKAGTPITAGIFGTNIAMPYIVSAMITGQLLSLFGLVVISALFIRNMWINRHNVDKVNSIGSEMLKAAFTPFISSMPILNKLIKDPKTNRYFDSLISDNFTESDAGNMRAIMFKVRVNMTLLTIYSLLNIILQGSKDDDDDKKKKAMKAKLKGKIYTDNDITKKSAYLLMNLVGKTYSDHNLTLDPRSTGERFSAVTTLFPVLGFGKKLYDATINPEYVGQTYDTADRKRGIKKGDFKQPVVARKLYVGINKMDQIQNAMERKFPVFDMGGN
jgi:hypothetical protein